MNLRRSDSLPDRFRDSKYIRTALNYQNEAKTFDSKTVSNCIEINNKCELVTIWESLQSDVRKIKNGTTKNVSRNVREESKEAISGGLAQKALIVNKNDTKKKTTYNNRILANSAADRTSSFPLDVVQNKKYSHRTSSADRRRSLLERLISWKTKDCDCKVSKRKKFVCTCPQKTDKTALFAERGRSKSVGYVPQRQIAQFRRCNSAAAAVGGAAALRQRAALTLARRYYPEGGWGWTVTAVGAVVHCIAHGLQLGGGTGPIARKAAVVFHVSPLLTYGE